MSSENEKLSYDQILAKLVMCILHQKYDGVASNFEIENFIVSYFISNNFNDTRYDFWYIRKHLPKVKQALKITGNIQYIGDGSWKILFPRICVEQRKCRLKNLIQCQYSEKFIQHKEEDLKRNYGITCSSSKCPFIKNDSDEILNIFMSPKDDSRENGCKTIHDFAKNARELLIIDPYMYKPVRKEPKEDISISIENTISEFKKTVSFQDGKLEKITVIHSGYSEKSKKVNTDKMNEDLRRQFKKLNSGKIEFSDFNWEELHDRIWIKDQKKGIMVGQSFNGLGNKVGLIVNIPPKDVDDIIDYCNKNIIHKKK